MNRGKLLKALDRAHFTSVCEELERETLTYATDDDDHEDPRWSFKAQLEKADPAGGWVN